MLQETLNWDVKIAELLSLTLISSLGARSGDVARSILFRGQQYAVRNYTEPVSSLGSLNKHSLPLYHLAFRQRQEGQEI